VYVKCVINDLSKLTDVPVAERLKEGIHIDGPITDLVIGEIYPVQAIEVHLDRGLWLYLHTVEVNAYPYPYPTEFFQIIDSTIPRDWQVGHGSLNEVLRLSFATWANNDRYYELLVDGDKKAEEKYAESRTK